MYVLFKVIKIVVICDRATENKCINHTINLLSYVSILTYDFLSFTIIIYFDTHIVSDLAHVNPFNRMSVSFWHLPIFLWLPPCFLVQSDVSGSSYTFSDLTLQSALFSKDPCFFLSGERFLVTKIWLHVCSSLLECHDVPVPRPFCTHMSR